MLNPYIAFGVFLLEMLICHIFFSNISKQKRSNFVCFLLGSFLALVGAGSNLLSQNDGGWNTITTTIIQWLFACICFDIKLYTSLFYSLFLVVISGAMESFVITFVSRIFGMEFLDYNHNFILFLIEYTVSKTLYFLIVQIVAHIAAPGKVRNRLPSNLVFYAAACAFCLVIFWYVNSYPGIPLTIQMVLSIASVLQMLSTILLFIFYQKQLEKETAAIHLQNELNRLQVEKSYYDILEQQNQQLMLYAHDAKNHLAAIKNLTDDPQITAYISSLSQQLADYTRNCHSGNKLLDVMIGKYQTSCEHKGIQFVYDVKLCNLGTLTDMDLVAVLGNLMDNALSAAEHSTGKMISLETAKRNSYSVLILTNSCDTAPETSGNQLVSTKENRDFHGFGLKSVAQTLKKYQGDFEWDYDREQKQFTITVMIGDPLPESPKPNRRWLL